ncbi:MAG TPA: rhomboid family intramembrane serine protease [Xanthomonadaceae bacterium]|jgi:membrane associated rhomboid family serine protease
MIASYSTLILIALTCVVSFVAFDNEKLMASLIFWPPAITKNHDYSRLLTYGFVHANGMHLLFNMFTLYFFGRAMEGFVGEHLGIYGFVFFYLSALVVSILPTYLRHREDAQYRSLGASGAVSAVLFAFILLRPWSTILVFALPVPAIVYAVFYLGYTIWRDRVQTDRVNHSAHLWGAVYGIVFMVLMDPHVIDVFFDELAHPRFGS